ncbi:zf-HC2 domain-containing protein [Actinomadura madurae]|uniref:zf-HC2 domain-containing protein n=1 Tax=Actinomadura madurae TaxID=1993 RepID=UPI0020D21EDA|nr:zf-HC2 domain-containing protein [Actinomadura madurae]MCP9948628.1 zf-HC2 domain-containing protein [Actinomadura madurae]MCQ0014077.1 zf-HC2 domain-containing protein [Actinomadura madurae]
MRAPDMPHVDVGAYALGLLEEPDRRAFEAHLSTCYSCHEELGALRGLAETLDGIGPIEDPVEAMPAPPEPAVVTDMMRHRIRRPAAPPRGPVAGRGGGRGRAARRRGGTGFTLGADRERAPAGQDGDTAALMREGG